MDYENPKAEVMETTEPAAVPAGIPGLTINRDVLFVPADWQRGQFGGEPVVAAKIVKVWSPDGMVNLILFQPNGATGVATSVPYDPTGERPYTWRFPPRVA